MPALNSVLAPIWRPTSATASRLPHTETQTFANSVGTHCVAQASAPPVPALARSAGWRDAGGHGRWTWHSLRHVFCTTALFTWKLEAADVSRMVGHPSYRITLDMYVGTTAGVLDRARTATE